ncbi:D-isomer specific 2-hydroxyacid dehydrogenase, partial [Chaetomidium leptoderma]
NDAEATRLVERLQPFDVISSVRERTAFPGSLLAQLPNLKLLLATGTQWERFDLETARQRGIALVSAPGLGRTDSPGPRRPNIKNGGVHSTTQDKADQMALQVGLSPDDGLENTKVFRAAEKEELFSSADVVSVHCVLSGRSRGIIGRRELDAMKPSSLLVNTSRGPLIDQPALRDTLERGHIQGCAMDVFDIEPLPRDSPWRKRDYWGQDGRSNVLVTPHMGYVDTGLMNTWYGETAENVERWLDGKELLHRLV